MKIDTIDRYDFEGMFGEGGACFSHEPQAVRPPGAHCSADRFASADVAETLGAVEGEHDEADWIWVGTLTDGRFAAVVAGCDYTGWD